MPELIDRIELRKDFCNMCEAMQPEMIDCDKKCCMSMQIIDEQPTIDPEVRHGRWIRRETVLDTECKCSVCGYKDFVPKHDNYWFRRKFCPNCGTDMREAIEDATDN